MAVRPPAPRTKLRPPPDRVIADLSTFAHSRNMTKALRDRRLARLDIKLLIVFQEAMGSGHAKLVADKLGMTQAAVSHSLRRLSDLVGSNLFVRSHGAMVPTDRAKQLAPAINKILAAARSIMPPEI